MSFENDPRAILVALAIVTLAGIVIGLALARWFRGATSRRRNRLAQRGERTAETILNDAGYDVIDRQARAWWSMAVDGVPVEIEVRADLLVRRRGRTFVAEVKTGNRAPDPRHPPTRRQLLEYSLVFGAREVLLVDVEAGEVRSIGFPAVYSQR